MPEEVYTGRHGVLLTLDRDEGGEAEEDQEVKRTVLGSFQDWRVTINQDLYEHHGPKDEWDYVTPRRLGWQVEITRYAPSEDATPGDDESDPLVMDDDVGYLLELIARTNTGEDEGDGVLVETVVEFKGKMGDDTEVSGNVHFTDLAEALSDDPDQETVTLRGTDDITITPPGL